MAEILSVIIGNCHIYSDYLLLRQLYATIDCSPFMPCFPLNLALCICGSGLIWVSGSFLVCGRTCHKVIWIYFFLPNPRGIFCGSTSKNCKNGFMVKKTLKSNQSSLAQFWHFLKISSNSIQSFLRYPVNKNLSILAEVDSASQDPKLRFLGKPLSAGVPERTWSTFSSHLHPAYVTALTLS